ncbi:MAG: hypothetical protein QG620_577 [Patescibacteria group bacterium]|nr:hypothetical protein [Patescibacteria group bacterium]
MINARLPEMIQQIEKDPEAVYRPELGRTYQILLAPLEKIVEMDELDAEDHSPEVVVIEAQENGLWLCAKLSARADSCYCGPFDLYLKDVDGYPHTLLEAWNTVFIHESDFAELGRAVEIIPNWQISDEWVERARELFHIYQSSGCGEEPPDHLAPYVGKTLECEDVDREDWRMREMGIMETVRRKIHEGA